MKTLAAGAAERSRQPGWAQDPRCRARASDAATPTAAQKQEAVKTWRALGAFLAAQTGESVVGISAMPSTTPRVA